MVVDLNHRFKYAAISALHNDQLIDLLLTVRNGGLAWVHQYLITSSDIDLVIEITDSIRYEYEEYPQNFGEVVYLEDLKRSS